MPELQLSVSAHALLLAALLTPAAVHADEAAPDDQIVVAALRTPVERDKVSSSVTVLDEAVIAQAQPVAVTDLLVRTPGISLTRNGGYGTATSLRIRGADSGQSVVVIDGMRLGDASTTDGGYGFSNLLTDDISRIEILRGPQSILWGSNAIGGVIDVTTRRAEKPLEGSFAVEAGSRDTLSARAGVGGTSDAVDWRLSGSTFTTAGISARANGTERDGYSRQSASGSATVRLAPVLSLDLRGYWADGRNDFDGTTGDTPAYGTTQEWTFYAGLTLSLLDGRLKNRVAVLEGGTDRQNFDPRRLVRPLNFDARGRTRRYEYQGSFSLGEPAEIVFGAEREEHRMTNASPADSTAAYLAVPSRASIDSVYAQLRLTPLSGLTLNGGARHDAHARFGGNTVFSAGAAWALNGGTTVLRAGYDEGFKAPSLYQLFSLYGSAALAPEKAKGWEVGAEQSLLADRVKLSAVWFERDTDNLIDFAYCPTTGTLPAECYVPGTSTTRFGYYANVRRAHAKGLELGGSLAWGRVRGEANYSIVVAEDRTPGSTFGRQLARVPRHLANAQLGYEFPFGLTTSVAVRYSGHTFDRATGTTVLDDYWLADVRGEWALSSGLTLQGRVENIGNRHYQTAGGYGSLGRSVYLGLRSRF